MNFNISVLAVEQTTKQGPKASYQQLEVSFKNLTSGKVESKKLMSFGNGNAFASLANAKAGDIFTVESQKNEKTGYWDWVSVTQAAPGAAVEQVANPTKPGFTPAPKSNYETPEERAKKQIYIVRQSSLSAAIATLTPGAKAPLEAEKVLELAKIYTDYVFEVAKPAAVPLAEMTDDVPY